MIQEKQIIKIVLPREKHWVGEGCYVRSIVSKHSEDNKDMSPCLWLEHAASKFFPPRDQKLGVGEHAHRGCETGTMARKGEVEHRDSRGGGGKKRKGGGQ